MFSPCEKSVECTDIMGCKVLLEASYSLWRCSPAFRTSSPPPPSLQTRTHPRSTSKESDPSRRRRRRCGPPPSSYADTSFILDMGTEASVVKLLKVKHVQQSQVCCALMVVRLAKERKKLLLTVKSSKSVCVCECVCFFSHSVIYEEFDQFKDKPSCCHGKGDTAFAVHCAVKVLSLSFPSENTWIEAKFQRQNYKPRLHFSLTWEQISQRSSRPAKKNSDGALLSCCVRMGWASLWMLFVWFY